MSDSTYNPLPPLIPRELIERAKKLSPALLCDGMKELGIVRDGCLDGAIMPVSDEMTMIGTACTVNTERGDNFPIHVAIYQSKPGYIILVDGKGYTDRPYMGDLMAESAKLIGVNGIVIDGYVRDKVGLKELGLPIYSRGFMQRGPIKENVGEVNTIINCGGVKVTPGDMVFGDYDGVTIIPRNKIEEVLNLAEKKLAYELKRRELFQEYKKCKLEGKITPNLAPSWVIEKLEKLGL